MSAVDDEVVRKRPVALTKATPSGPQPRRDTVEAEIALALECRPDELLRRVRVLHRSEPDSLSEECLVYLARDARVTGNDILLHAAWTTITARTSPHIESKLRTLGSHHVEDGVAKVHSDLGLAVLDLNTNRGDFFQVSFWTVIDRRTISEFHRQRRIARKDNKLTSLEFSTAGEGDGELGYDPDNRVPLDETQDWGSESFAALDRLEMQDCEAERTARIETALATLPDLVRRAFVLHVEGWQIESEDPSKPTIAKALQRTPRTISNYLRKAENHFQRQRGGSDDRRA